MYTHISQLIIKSPIATIYMYVLGCIEEFSRPMLLSVNEVDCNQCYICVGNVVIVMEVSICEKY